MVTALLIVVPLIATLLAECHSQRAKRARRAAYLATYPTADDLLAVLDQDKYREIRARHGRNGDTYAARAVQLDYPGISPAELGTVVSGL